ncbi:MAG TPA: CsgG/HfaB family protein [Blastocatellia bacterium]|nr:CsgG/HfaB family protein [Blastocatellia bacterium]
MRKINVSMLTVLLGVLVASVNAQAPKERVYVWDFVDTHGQQTSLTGRMTLEFEEALTQARCYQIVERRQFDRVLAHIKNEKAIADLNDISKASQGEVRRITNAQIVVFGKVDDDIASGEFKITVTFQRFDSSKEVKSIRMRRGRIQDSESRENAMKDLVKQTCGVGNASPVSGRYVNSKNPSSYFELKPDGTLFVSLVQPGGPLQSVGAYEVDGKQITLKFEMGRAARGIVEKDKISFENGDVFLRQSDEAASTSHPPSPGITVGAVVFVQSRSERIAPSHMSILGLGWDGGSEIRIIVNGQDISKRIDAQRDGNISLNGTVKQLSVHDGKNEVVVVVNGVRSNTYEFKQVIK